MKNFEKEDVVIPEDFNCPLTLQPMFDPVVADDGETYEREAIQECIDRAKQEKKKLKSPLHQTEIGDKLIPNRRMISNIREFLTKHPQCIDSFYFPKSSVNESLDAIENGQIEVLHQLIEKDRRLLQRELAGKRILIELVCEFGSEAMISLAVAHLKKIDKFSFSQEKQEELLLLCAKAKNVNGIKVLIAESQWTETDKKHFFIKQIQKGCITLVELFLLKIIDINEALDENNNTPLHVAVIYNQKSIVDLLLASGANSKFVNKQLQRAEQLAMELGNNELATYIPKRRQEIKLGPLKAEIEKLKRENAVIEEKTAKIAEERDNLKNKLTQLQCDLQKFKVQSNLKPAFFTPKSLKKLEQTEEFNRLQKDFINAIFAGDLEEVTTLHQKGASLTKATVTREYIEEPKQPSSKNQGVRLYDSEMLILKRELYNRKEVQVKHYPLVAAVYGGDKAVLTYIENALGEQAKQYWLLVDENKIKQRFDKIIPCKRPPGATIEWLGKWYMAYANCAWRKYYDASAFSRKEEGRELLERGEFSSLFSQSLGNFKSPLKKKKPENWGFRGNAMADSLSYVRTEEKSLDRSDFKGYRKVKIKDQPIKDQKWERSLMIYIDCGDGTSTYTAPDPQQHDKCVEEIIQQMQILRDEVLKKITNAKLQPLWRPFGFDRT